MKKNQYIAPVTEVMHIELQQMIAVSLTVNEDSVTSTDDLLSRESYDMWDDED